MYTSFTLVAAAAGLASAATTYKASFTQYGSTDTWGSGNCNVKTTACGFYTSVRNHHLIPALRLHPPLPSLSSILTTPIPHTLARLLGRRISKRIRGGHRRRRRPGLRHLLETDSLNRQLGQQQELWRAHCRANHQPVPGGEQPSVRAERAGRN